MQQRAPALSVCIVTFNSGDTIRDCLESLAKQSGVGLEAIVVDNASSDDSADQAASFPFCRVIRNPRNVFFAPANNQALRASRGEFVLVLNPDTVLEPDAAAQMVDALRAQPKLGAAICTIIGDAANGSPEVPHWWQRRRLRDLLGSLQPWLWWRERHGVTAGSSQAPGSGSTEDLDDLDVISDACLFGRRVALEQIGWYDERYRLYFTEDDLCHRLKVAGWRIGCVPSVRVRHRGSTSTRKVPRLWLRWLTVKDLLAYARQHLGVGAWLVLLFPAALDLILVALVRGAKWLRSFNQRAPRVADAA
jgi:GT2 family glycosyltransferase